MKLSNLCLYVSNCISFLEAKQLAAAIFASLNKSCFSWFRPSLLRLICLSWSHADTVELTNRHRVNESTPFVAVSAQRCVLWCCPPKRRGEKGSILWPPEWFPALTNTGDSHRMAPTSPRKAAVQTWLLDATFALAYNTQSCSSGWGGLQSPANPFKPLISFLSFWFYLLKSFFFLHVEI